MNRKQPGSNHSVGDYDRACGKAFACLGRKALTRAELIKKLTDEGFTEDVIDDVMDMLVRCNYINDERFARDFVENGTNVKKHGRIRIVRELRARGIPKELIDMAFEDMEETELEEQELSMALEHLRYRTRDDHELDEREKKRCFDYLLRRGFTFQTARHAIEAYTTST